MILSQRKFLQQVNKQLNPLHLSLQADFNETNIFTKQIH